MTDLPILSIVTFLPLVGALITFLIWEDSEVARRNVRYVALFTTVVSFLIFFIGHFQADALEFYLKGEEAGQTALSQYAALGFSMLIPNFQLFNVVDGLVQNQPISLAMVGKLIGVAFYYVLLYTLTAWWVFSDKEV